MPSSLTDQEIGAAVKPPIADCCFPAPPVLELDPDGRVLQAWGGPGAGYTWFDQEHGIYIDHNNFVWMGTSNGTHVMKFTRDGKYVMTIGEPGANKGSNDPDHLGGPANFYVEPKTNELFRPTTLSQSTSWRKHADAATIAPTISSPTRRISSPAMKPVARWLLFFVALTFAHLLAGCASYFEADSKAPLVQDKPAVPLTPNVLGGAGGSPP